MPKVPERKLSLGERLDKKRKRKFEKKVKWQSAQRKAFVQQIIEERYQSRLARRLIERIPFDTEL